MITRIKETYLVKDGNYSRTFETGASGISIPGKYNHSGLTFMNSKKQCVKSFYKALGEFISIIETDGNPNTHNSSETTTDGINKQD